MEGGDRLVHLTVWMLGSVAGHRRHNRQRRPWKSRRIPQGLPAIQRQSALSRRGGNQLIMRSNIRGWLGWVRSNPGGTETFPLHEGEHDPSMASDGVGLIDHDPQRPRAGVGAIRHDQPDRRAQRLQAASGRRPSATGRERPGPLAGSAGSVASGSRFLTP